MGVPTPFVKRVPPAELARLAQLFQAGRLPEMEVAAREATTRCPHDGIAWKALGAALLALGKDALAPMQRARELLPGDVEVLGNLGVLLGRHGRWQEAAACHRRALELQPALAEAHCNLADALAALGEWDASAASCREALRWRPDFAAALANLGRAQAASGQAEAAVDSYRRAVALRPGLAPAHHGLALALLDLGQAAAARIALREALRLQPGQAAAWFQLAALEVAAGLPAEAETAYRRALAIEPDRHEAWANLGSMLMDQGRHQDAAGAFERSWRLRPEQPALLSNVGNALLAAGHVDEALQALEAAVEAAPDDAILRGNLAHACVVAGEPARAVPHLDRALASQPGELRWHTERLFVRRYLDASVDDQRLALEAARRYGALVAARARPFDTWLGLAGAETGDARRGDPEKCLRVGWVSGDLRAHPVAWFLRSVLAALARRPTLELWAYATRPRGDEVSLALREHVAHWQQVEHDSDEALAARIHRDGIDVLIDLSGHTRHNRLAAFAWRPAPLQLSWLGSCASTGSDAIDAVVVDRWIAPPGTERDFVEPLWRLPDCFLCFTPPDRTVELADLAAPSVARSAPDAPVRLACFNRLAKVGDAVVATWSRIMARLPGATLALQDPALRDAGVRQRLLQRFAVLGIGAERLLLHPAQPRDAYLASYREVDIALDPFPYPGGTTTLEALWMGVPVLTLPGVSALSRQGASVLHTLGLPDWVTDDQDDYVDKAVRHAQARAEVAALKNGLRERLLASPLCDAARFAAALEGTLRNGWRERCRSR